MPGFFNFSCIKQGLYLPYSVQSAGPTFKKPFLKIDLLLSSPIPVQRDHTLPYLSSADIPVQRRCWPIPVHTRPYSPIPVQRRCVVITAQPSLPYLFSVGERAYLLCVVVCVPIPEQRRRRHIPEQRRRAHIPEQRRCVRAYLFSVGVCAYLSSVGCSLRRGLWL